ncbi:MAG: hypothetical protein N3B01_09885 [Verrucomicrobiae bacterium]|nr:hypothetical protein [Verrucomicrobiae bacterium]
MISRKTNALAALWIAAAACFVPDTFAQKKKPMSQREMIDLILANTTPLRYPRGKRLPLYLWPLHGLGTTHETEAERLLKELDSRGLPVIATWDPSPQRRAESLQEALWLGRLQKKLGLGITVNATACMHYFCNGDERTAHIGDDGKPFFDFSFHKKRPIGCPFALEFRHPLIREQVEFFLDAYQREDLTIHFLFVDWEIDGPIEWNDSWANSKRCRRCRQHIADINDFRAFQRVLRTIRCRMQRGCLVEPVLKRFPKALVGNYAVYPNDGWRYWYDFFEKLPPDAPFRADQRAKYRPWFQEFPLSGYTVSMPVVYTWYATPTWYDFANYDYRWFYNLLLVASTSGRHKAPQTPSIPFVHWHTTSPPKEPDPNVKQFSAEKYQELLWHMLLRGHDTFFLWCPREEAAVETRLLHEVWAAALQYREFLEHGQPLIFDVPTSQAPVVSAVRLHNRMLVRRTDFDGDNTPVNLTVDGTTIPVPRAEGRCQILTLSSR